MTVLVVDVGTSSVRAMVIDDAGAVVAERHQPTLPTSPSPGLVEFDPAEIRDVSIALARQVIKDVADRDGAPPVAVGIANQRASTVLWDAETGDPLGPGLGWQDLRTVGRCLELNGSDLGNGRRVAPNMTATKAEWLVAHAGDVSTGRLRIGTIDSWLAWCVSAGDLHITDATNAAVTGLTDGTVTGWDEDLLEVLRVPTTAMPAIVDTVGPHGAASVLEGSPTIAALVGDQQASLIGQGGIEPGRAKITFGTGAMLDLCVGPEPVLGGGNGTFPIIARRQDGRDVFGLEAVMLSAGAAVEWLRDGLGLISDVAESATVAATVPDSGGVTFVPSLSGTGTPDWDHGARGLLGGLSLGSTRGHVVRAVLEGVAHRGADLIDAVVAAGESAGVSISELSVDGGMTANPVFVQALADTSQREITVSTHREATAIGAGLLAGVGAGVWPDLGTASQMLPPGHVVTPGTPLDRDAFRSSRTRAGRWIPELSSLDL